MTERIHKQVKRLKEFVSRFLLRAKQFPFRSKAVPPVFLLQFIIPGHYPIFHVLQSELLVKHREILRVFDWIRARQSANGERCIAAGSKLEILWSYIVSGDGRRNTTIEIGELHGLKIRDKQHLVN